MPTATPTRALPQTQPQAPVPAPAEPDSALPAPVASPTTPLESGGPTLDLPDTATPTSTATQDTQYTEAAALPDWWWIAAILAALAAIGAALFFWRRKQASAVPPTIEAPVVASDDTPIMADDLLRYLKVELEPVKMSRSMMASTLSYRLTLTNRAPGAMRGLTLDGDLTSAHGQAPIAEQMADALTALPDIHALDHLGPGQRKSFTGEMRLPLNTVRPIRQGNVPIYVPLMRLKVSAAGAEPKAFTFVVGKRPAQPGGRLQPFRLDVPPQTYSEVDSRPLA